MKKTMSKLISLIYRFYLNPIWFKLVAAIPLCIAVSKWLLVYFIGAVQAPFIFDIDTLLNILTDSKILFTKDILLILKNSAIDLLYPSTMCINDTCDAVYMPDCYKGVSRKDPSSLFMDNTDANSGNNNSNDGNADLVNQNTSIPGNNGYARAEESPDRISRERHEETSQRPSQISSDDLQDAIVRVEAKLHYERPNPLIPTEYNIDWEGDENFRLKPEDREAYIARKRELTREWVQRQQNQNNVPVRPIDRDNMTQGELDKVDYKTWSKTMAEDSERGRRDKGGQPGLNVKGLHVCNGCRQCRAGPKNPGDESDVDPYKPD